MTIGGPGDQLGTSVTANGTLVVNQQSVLRGEFVQRSFNVTVSGGQLDLQFSQINNVAFGPHWAVNAISIVPTSALAAVTAGANIGNVVANGSTSSVVTFSTSAPNGTHFTVSSTLGTITTADANASVSGIQVASAGGLISINLTAPTKFGTPTFTVHSIDGAHSGTISNAAFVNFTQQAVRRFDFNNGSKTGTVSATAAGFTSVSRDHQSPATDGFGFGENNVVSFVVTAADIPGATNDDLFRDGVQNGHTTSTFLVQAAAATNYDVRVYLGHTFLTRDNIEVTVEGADTATQTATTTSESGPRFTSLTFTNADDTNADGFITVSFVDRGGSNFGYSINGLDIATAGALPAAATLLAGGFAAQTFTATTSNSALDLTSNSNSTASNATAATLPTAPVVALLTANELAPIIAIATESFLTQLAVTSEQAALLSTANFVIADLSGGVLAELLGQTIYIDDDAAGAGWYTSLNRQVTADRYDLLTTVAHELGHLLGLDHADSTDDLMSDTLNPGQRHHSLDAIDNFFGKALGETTPFE